MHIRLCPPVVLVAFLIAAVAARAAADPSVLRSVDPPAKHGALAPNLWTSGNAILMSWLEPIEGKRGSYALRFARFESGAWSEPRTITERDDFFANWADLPSITRHPNGWLLAHWLQKSGPGTYAYDVVLAQSPDEGETWTTLGPAHDDGTQTEHGFVSRIVEGDSVRLFWLDGREMKPEGDGHGDGANDHGHGYGDMQLRTAVVPASSGSSSLRSSDAGVMESVVLDPRVCECCGTDAVMTSKGPIVVYRGRSDEEVRDILVARKVDGEWTKPKTVHDDNWGISGCPVNGPVVAARGERVAVAWHTGANLEPRVLLAFSDDSGATFGKPIVIDNDEPPGRVDLVMDEAGAATVCWLGRDENGGVIRIRRVKPDGEADEPRTVARTTAARNSGFPRIGLVGGDLLVVWRDEENRLRAAMPPSN